MDEEKAFLAEKTLGSNLHLRSDMAQEIVSRKPDFLEKWALLIVAGILLLLLGATWFIKYPDVIEASCTLTAFNAPKEIVTREQGRLARLLVHNNERVVKDEVLGWIESTANSAEVLELSRQLDSSVTLLNPVEGEKVSRLLAKGYDNLGEIQQAYQTFTTALLVFNDYIVNGFYVRKRAMLTSDIRSLDSTSRIMQNQRFLTEQDVKLTQETYDMNKKLYDEKIISAEELRGERSKLLNKQIAVPQLEASLLSLATQKRDKLKELDQMDHDIAQEQLTFRQALQSLKSSVDDWKKRFILQSPIDGRVVFTIPLQENQFLPQGKLLGYVTPGDSHVYAEVTLPQSNFGKLDTGLSVQLRLDAYPYEEIGFVGGTLNYISNIPSDSGFLASVRLDKGLVTNNGKVIPYRNGLRAQALIITRNMRLLQRLWYGVNRSTSVGSK